ncbi:MAG TPA: IclR family transcriptional regulator [Paenalcaligenes sp.]|nr:IclR family transcriptional regulator [Paenalcaligenes sp.]
MSNNKPVLAVVRALSVLNAFQPNEPSLTLQELSVRTGLYKSTLLRQLHTLIEEHCVARLDNGEYQLGARVLQWAHVYTSSLNLEQHVPPVLNKLVELTGEGASFFVRDGDMRVCLYRADSKKELRDHIRQGELLPLKKGAAGKILLHYCMEKETKKPEVFVSIGEREEEIAAIAAPVFSSTGVKGALAISGPATRFSEESIEQWKLLVFNKAKRLSQVLGGERFYQ